MKFILLIIFYSCTYWTTLLCQDSDIKSKINDEIVIINLCYSDRFFNKVTPHGSNFIDKIKDTIVFSKVIKGTVVDLIKTDCELNKGLFKPKYNPDTLVFYSIKIDNQSYRVFGFMFNDFPQMCYETGIPISFLIKFIEDSKCFKKSKLKQLEISVKRNSIMNQKVNYPIQYFKKSDYPRPHLKTIILPVNFNELIIIN